MSRARTVPRAQASTRYARLAEVARLVEQFEDCSLPRQAWRHDTHLTVALRYMLHHDEAKATSMVVDGIRAYNRAHRIRQTRSGGYHETMTLFWLAITRHFIRSAPRGVSELELFNRFLESYAGRPDLFREYYSEERIFSWDARRFWVEPDLRALEA